MNGLSGLFPPIHLYAILVAAITLLGLMGKAQDHAKAASRFVRWSPILLVSLAYLEIAVYMIQQLAYHGHCMERHEFWYLVVHGIVLILFCVVGSVLCRQYMEKVGMLQHSLSAD